MQNELVAVLQPPLPSFEKYSGTDPRSTQNYELAIRELDHRGRQSTNDFTINVGSFDPPYSRFVANSERRSKTARAIRAGLNRDRDSAAKTDLVLEGAFDLAL